MFNVSLSDRLKAAVNTLEQTGSSLQARAIGQGQTQQPQSPSSATQQTATASLARSISPKPPTSSSSATGAASPGAEALSPTRNYSTSQLAENALSGLRKSFHFARDGQQQAHSRTASGSGVRADGGGVGSGGSGGSGPQELKDITSPTQPATSSRPSSPAPSSARFLSTLAGGGNSNFALGNDTPSATGTPSRPRSPNPLGRSSLANRAQLPSPNPDDPASYPLPPSPEPASAALPLLSPVPPSAFNDPLGASPSIEPQVPPDPPALGLHAPTPDGATGGARDTAPAPVEDGELGTSTTVAAAEMETAVVQKVEEAAKRYEGE